MMIESTSGFTNEAWWYGLDGVGQHGRIFLFSNIQKPPFVSRFLSNSSAFSQSFSLTRFIFPVWFNFVFFCVCFFFSMHCWNGRSQLERELVCCQQRTWKSWRMRKPRHLGRPTRRTRLRRWPKSGCQSRKMRRRRKPAGRRPTSERRQCWHSGQ